MTKGLKMNAVKISHCWRCNAQKRRLLKKVEVNYLCSLQIAHQVNLPEYIVNAVEVDYTS